MRSVASGPAVHFWNVSLTTIYVWYGISVDKSSTVSENIEKHIHVFGASIDANIALINWSLIDPTYKITPQEFDFNCGPPHLFLLIRLSSLRDRVRVGDKNHRANYLHNTRWRKANSSFKTSYIKSPRKRESSFPMTGGAGTSELFYQEHPSTFVNTLRTSHTNSTFGSWPTWANTTQLFSWTQAPGWTDWASCQLF